jgi:hypothetical protein
MDGEEHVLLLNTVSISGKNMQSHILRHARKNNTKVKTSLNSKAGTLTFRFGKEFERGKYPWTLWTNGRTHTVHASELEISLGQFQTQLHAWARNNSDWLVQYKVITIGDSKAKTLTFHFYAIR